MFTAFFRINTKFHLAGDGKNSREIISNQAGLLGGICSLAFTFFTKEFIRINFKQNYKQ